MTQAEISRPVTTFTTSTSPMLDSVAACGQALGQQKHRLQVEHAQERDGTSCAKTLPLLSACSHSPRRFP